MLGRGRDSTYYLVDCALSQAYTRRFSAREGARISPGRVTGAMDNFPIVPLCRLCRLTC